MGKHTPGPWVLGSDKTQVLHARLSGPCRLIASTNSPECIDGKGNHSLDRSEMEANARLIAAAPEMLACLKYIAKALPNRRLAAWAYGGGDDDLEYVLEMIAKAINDEEVP